jgi:hypothetical protein
MGTTVYLQFGTLTTLNVFLFRQAHGESAPPVADHAHARPAIRLSHSQATRCTYEDDIVKTQ